MESRRPIVLLFSTLIVSLFGFSGDRETEIRKVLNAKKFESAPVLYLKTKKPPLEVEEVVPRAEGPHVRMGKAAEWGINNTAKANGWSFTGWSKTGLDEDFRPWRFHIGVISGELDANKAYDLSAQHRRIPRYELLEEWERERTNAVVFGIVFIKRF